MKKTILATVWYEEQFELEVNVNATDDEIDELINKEMRERDTIDWDTDYEDIDEE